MSAVTRAIVRAYRTTLSTRPDGEIHVMDAQKIVHVVLDRWPFQRTGCGISVNANETPDIEPGPVLGPEGPAIPTWDDVSCIACLTRNRP